MSFARIIAAFMILLSALAPSLALADEYGLVEAATQASLQNKKIAGGNTAESVVGGVIRVALGAVGIVFFILLVYSGFNWMLARGNAEAVETSKKIIEGLVIGLIIVISAYAITYFVFNSLETGVADTSAGATPTP